MQILFNVPRLPIADIGSPRLHAAARAFTSEESVPVIPAVTTAVPLLDVAPNLPSVPWGVDPWLSAKAIPGVAFAESGNATLLARGSAAEFLQACGHTMRT